jgi:hypothetical protein
MAAHALRKGDVFTLYSSNLPEYAVVVHGILMSGTETRAI